MNFVRRQIGHLLYGFIFWLPIGIIAIAGSYIFSGIEDFGKDFLDLFFPENSIHAGLGTVFWLFVFFLTGLLLKLTPVGTLLSGVPVLGFLFRKSGETMTLERLQNLTPCLFLYSPTCLSYGWIISEQKVTLNNEMATFSLINVYYPNVPTMVTGQVYSARKETVIRLGNKSREIVDVLLYGLRRPEYLEYRPWEDESEQEFKRRARDFGLALGADGTETPIS